MFGQCANDLEDITSNLCLASVSMILYFDQCANGLEKISASLPII